MESDFVEPIGEISGAQRFDAAQALADCHPVTRGQSVARGCRQSPGQFVGFSYFI
jgi:hypothetical protein